MCVINPDEIIPLEKTTSEEVKEVLEKVRRARGRPKGSKNKVKQEITILNNA